MVSGPGLLAPRQEQYSRGVWHGEEVPNSWQLGSRAHMEELRQKSTLPGHAPEDPTPARPHLFSTQPDAELINGWIQISTAPHAPITFHTYGLWKAILDPNSNIISIGKSICPPSANVNKSSEYTTASKKPLTQNLTNSPNKLCLALCPPHLVTTVNTPLPLRHAPWCTSRRGFPSGQN